MTVLLSMLVFLSLSLFLWQRARYREINNELRYIRERIEQEPYIKENAYILIPSEHMQIKELAAGMNRLLDKYYTQKADYEHSRQAMLQVLTNISHDLRTPLTVLKGYSELLKKETETADAEKIRDMADKIDDKADELVRTINEYFTMSKITSGDMKIDLQQINVTELCHDVILDYYDLLERERYHVEIDTDSPPKYAYADRDALIRILKNLTDNAIRHGGAGKYLALRLKSANGKVKIEVEDHGPGIPKRDQEQIFYRTYTTARRASGSGLGLTIAKNLALQMGADLQVTSEPGYRTIFTLVLKS